MTNETKTVSAEELATILQLHADWLADPSTGERADLSGANLSGANLSGAILPPLSIVPAYRR